MVQSQVISAATLANGLRSDFFDTYEKIRNRQADGRLGSVMDLSIGATNRQHEFAYYEAAPHMEYWKRGESIPTDAMDSVRWSVPVYNWARRIPWHKDDRKDDQTQSLYTIARQAGESAALLPERFFFDLIQGATDTLPAVPLAPDGVALYSTTDGKGGARFEATNGNLLTGTGVATSAAIRGDYYAAIEQFMAFRDGKGQPLLSPEVISSGVIIIHGAENTEVFEETFLQQRQGLVYGSNTAAATPSNLVLDSSRNIELWGTPRITGNDFYIFLRQAPTLPTFLLDREGIQEFSSLEGENNSDNTRDTGEEYIQFERRAGAGIGPAFGTIKINN